MTGKFSFFKNGIKNKKSKLDTTLFQALQKIKNDYEKDITNLRNATDKSVRNVMKSGLDYFCFSGTFKERSVEGLIQHSGFICLDLDLNGEYNHKEIARQLGISVTEAKEKYPDKIFIDEYNVTLIKYLISLDQYTLACFQSPSGGGIKIILNIDGDKHAENFTFLEKYYLEKFGLFIDLSGSDVSRACFVSYDPEVFLNPYAKKVLPVAGELITQVGKVLEIKSNGKITEIDTDTGEVKDVSGFEGWSREKKKHYERTRQVVQRVVEKKEDITGQYDDWLSIGLSFATFGELGRELYHSISQFHPEYKQKDCDYKFDNYLKTGRFKTPDKFFSICKEYNIDIKAVKTLEPAAAEGSEGKGYQDMCFEWPEGCEGTQELKQHTYRYNFLEFENRYHYAHFDNNKRTVSFFTISNFIIRPLFLVMSKAEPKRIIEIENIYGVKKVIDIPTKAFVSLTDFNCFVESQGNFLFDGDKTKFQKIKAKLYDLSRNAEEVKTLGYQRDGFYAFANGIYNPAGKDHDAEGNEIERPKFEPTDDHGVIEFKKKNYFIPALSSIYKDEEDDFESQKKFLFIRNKLKYIDWSKEFCKVHKDNGKIGLLYFTTSLFRDLIYQRFKFFPHLFLFGPPGSGKSQLGWSVSYLFGEAQLPFNLNGGTKVAFHKKFAMFRNAVIWFDEYNNAIDYARIQALKAAYDGTGHEKSEMTSANRTKTTPVNSGCIISGQELPIADNALFKRTVLLQYAQTEFSDEEAKAHASFRAMEQKGLSHITGHITTLRDLVEKTYHEEFDATLKEFKGILERESNIEERIIQNMVILVTMFKVLEKRLGFPFTYEEIRTIAVNNIKNQNAMIANAKETSTFWDLIEFMIDRGDIKDKIDFKIEMASSVKIITGRNEEKSHHFVDAGGVKTKKVLFMRLAKIHPLYLEMHRRQYNKNGLDKGSLVHYLSNNKGFIGNVKSTKFENANTSAFAFDYDALYDEGIELERIPEPLQSIIQATGTDGGATTQPNQLKISTPNDDDTPF